MVKAWKANLKQKYLIATNTNATVFLYAKPILDDVPTLCD